MGVAAREGGRAGFVATAPIARQVRRVTEGVGHQGWRTAAKGARMSREEWIVLGAIGIVVAVVSLVWAIRLALRLVAVRRALVSLGGKGTAVFWAAMIYTIFPIDI